jgi:hypothetical protein
MFWDFPRCGFLMVVPFSPLEILKSSKIPQIRKYAVGWTIGERSLQITYMLPETAGLGK